MTIYLDVLLLTNLWADYAMLRVTARLTHAPLPRLRGLLAAGLGALSSLAIFLPPLPVWVCLPLRVLLTCLLCMCAFGLRPWRQLLRQMVWLLAVSAMFGGTAVLLPVLLAPIGCCIRNTVVYTDVSLLTLLAGTTVAAAVSTCLARRREALPQGDYRLLLTVQGRAYSLPALADTGNTLRDAFTGKAVAVCAASALAGFLSAYPDAVSAASQCRGFRMLPVQTVSGRCLLPAFQPDCAALCRGTDAPQPVDILIAVSADVQAPAIVPACVIT